MESDDHTPRRGTQTAARALELLRAVVVSEVPMSLTELQAATGLNRGAVSRLMSELEEQLFVTRDPATRRYAVGSGLVALSAQVFRGINMRGAARPVLAAIRDLTGETVALHVRHLQHRICIETLESTQPIKRVVPLGEMLPLFAGPTGKVMLAHLPEAEARPILEWAEREDVDLGRVRAQLEEIRSRGCLIRVGDRIPGVGAISVPVFSVDGVAGAVTVSGPGDRFTLDAVESLSGEIVAMCAQLSAALGGIVATPEAVDA